MDEKDYELIRRIVARTSVTKRKIELQPDIAAVHLTYGLNLKNFLNAKPFDFYHDLAGIVHYLDRETGKLEGLFRPKFLKKSPGKEKNQKFCEQPNTEKTSSVWPDYSNSDPVGDLMDLIKRGD